MSGASPFAPRGPGRVEPTGGGGSGHRGAGREGPAPGDRAAAGVRGRAARPAGPAEPDVRLVEIRKRFGTVEAVQGVTLDVRSGEFLTLLGPSGCGKTTTLNMIAGFLRPTSGEIWLRGQRVETLPSHRRDTAMVFQQYALFPHMTVFDNIAFGLRMRRAAPGEIRRRVARALDQVGLAGLDARFPLQLSGGQQQRVALARAIVVEPAVLLLDEPLSNLDLKLREAMRLELKRLHRELGVTTVYVTHDQAEALVLSTCIAVMNRGRIEQVGGPQEIYERPATRFVADFVGVTNFLRGRVLAVNDTAAVVEIGGGVRLRCAREGRSPALREGRGAVVSVRPEQIHVEAAVAGDTPAATDGRAVGRVGDIVYLGGLVRYTVRLPGGDSVIVEEQHAPGKAVRSQGSQVRVAFDEVHCRLFDAPEA